MGYFFFFESIFVLKITMIVFDVRKEQNMKVIIQSHNFIIVSVLAMLIK